MTDALLIALRQKYPSAPRPPSSRFWFRFAEPLTAKGVVRAICRDHQIPPEDFFDRKARRSDIVACRVDAIRQLRAAGYSMAAISRAVGRHYDTVRHWVDAGKREKRLAAMRARHLKNLGTT